MVPARLPTTPIGGYDDVFDRLVLSPSLPYKRHGHIQQRERLGITNLFDLGSNYENDSDFPLPSDEMVSQ